MFSDGFATDLPPSPLHGTRDRFSVPTVVPDDVLNFFSGFVIQLAKQETQSTLDSGRTGFLPDVVGKAHLRHHDFRVVIR